MYIDFDSDKDVLYVRREQGRICTSREFTGDCNWILSYDANRTMVGLIVLDASAMVSIWYRHPVKKMLPMDLLESLDSWFSIRIN